MSLVLLLGVPFVRVPNIAEGIKMHLTPPFFAHINIAKTDFIGF